MIFKAITNGHTVSDKKRLIIDKKIGIFEDRFFGSPMMTNTHFRPLVIGSLKLCSNLIQGPLAGYSCSAMRRLTRHFPGCAYTTTEMISAHQLVHGKHNQMRYLHKADDENIVSYQLSGRCPDILKQATVICEQHGADIIDLNCGCPQPKIRKKQQGSKQIENPEKLYDLICSMRSATTLPLTAKIRLLPSQQGDNKTVIDALIQGGVDAITVHGRTWQDNYDVDCNWAAVREIVQYSRVPIIANGSVSSTAEAISVLETTHADAVMLSRAGLGKPWLFNSILNQVEPQITPTTKKRLLIEHLSGLAQLDGEFKALLQARSLVKYYFPKLSGLAPQSSLEQLYQCINNHDSSETSISTNTPS